MNNLKAARLTTTSGCTWETSISAQSTQKSINEYFLNKYFNVGIYPIEKMEKVIKAELIR